ncbi:winged helix-turn-helix domain-containing protein [Actinomarinicola tropica]|uniref:Helix-turn-helix domain-containing protein n=1 Tax=Actinomarinicola tropica TaxID=2789776 RepID=A0A5Q2RRL8_9ACTN|nr:helix-turn-helix domain-containing protein [Actinomarinicola tropica]QGG96787.1 helix-turn-helix domain-containing protein [Actinomarinicola tropica]
MDVVLVRWPDERDRREELRRSGRPRLLLLEDGSPAPTTVDALEDWIRLPADESDVRARVQALELRAIGTGHVPDVPSLDDDGVLRCNGSWVALPPVECRLTAALLDRWGAVVSRDALSRAGWPDGAPGRNALDVHVLRLRRRLEPLDLVIRTVRSRGYVLEAASDSGQARVSQA